MFQEREKQDQLHEILSDYSQNGLPPFPPLLLLGRPTFEPEIFDMEPHWSGIVDKETVRVRKSLLLSFFLIIIVIWGCHQI